MKTFCNRQFFLAHGFLAILICISLFAPKARPTVREPWSMLVGLAVIELLFLLSIITKQKNGILTKGPYDIILFVWILIIIWELWSSVFNKAHPVLIPCPENIFDTFRVQWRTMLLNVGHSMQLLFVGFSIGLILATALGLIAGWTPRLREFAYPIANVMAPIPAIVFSPYLVSLMPSFRSASALVIILGVFWPTFLTTINRVVSIEPQILDSARMLNLNNRTMITHVLLPYILPGVVSGLRVSVATSMLSLNFAELMGATHGMGYYVQNSITYANYTQAVAGIVVIGIVVTVLNSVVKQIQKRAIKWR
ncbi:MAG: ABC transporter permease [Fastidiosipilaceae bacterium]